MNFHDIDDTRELVYARAGYRCEVCNAPLSLVAHPQLAHRIPQKTRYLVRYGKAIIHHPDNLAATCSLVCNKKVDIGGQPLAVAELAARIRAKL